MKSKNELLHKWRKLKLVWLDDVARNFERRHLSKVIGCMESMEREYEKFRSARD